MKRNKSGFSLAELLVVIVIMSVLAAISMPAFNAMMGGTGLEAATQDVKAMISQARQYAIMNNTPTQFVIASSNSLLSSDDQDKWMKACCIYDVRKQKFVKSWKFLPEGIVFDKLDTTNFKNPVGDDTNIFTISSGLAKSHKLDGRTITGNHWIGFTPNGRADWNVGNTPKKVAELGLVSVVVAEGFTVPGDSTGAYQQYPNTGRGGVGVSRNTGRAVAKVL